MKANWPVRRVLTIIAAVMLTVAAFTWPDILAYVNGATPANRQRLYSVRNAISPDMSRAALRQILDGADDPIKVIWKTADEAIIWVPVGFMDRAYLEVTLVGDSVKHARVRGDGGEQLIDAPRDF